MNSATHSRASRDSDRRAVHGTVGPLVGHLHPGDVLIPQGRSYCIRIDKLVPVRCAGWDGRVHDTAEPGYQRAVGTRYDLTPDREPLYEHGMPLHCLDLRPVGRGVFRDCHGRNCWSESPPQYWTKWKPRSGQLCLF